MQVAKGQFRPSSLLQWFVRLCRLTVFIRAGAAGGMSVCLYPRPEEQKGVMYNDAFEILVNPYPIFEDHLTVPLRWHEKQQIKPYYEDMLDIVSDLSDYALFYNGPKCGASAPDHMHFQAGKKEEFPVVRNWPNFPKQVVWESERTGFYASVDLLPVCFILVSRDKGEAAAVFELLRHDADGTG